MLSGVRRGDSPSGTGDDGILALETASGSGHDGLLSELVSAVGLVSRDDVSRDMVMMSPMGLIWREGRSGLRSLLVKKEEIYEEE